MSKTWMRGALLALLIAGGVIAALMNATITPTQAQTGIPNLSQLIETLNGRVATEPGFELYFQLEQPLFAGETLIGIGATSTRTISDIAIDYVCFAEPWNNGQRIQCTPFTNVVSVSYLE